MDRGASWAIVHGVTKRGIGLDNNNALYYIILYIKLTNSVLKMKSIFLPLQFYDSFLLKEVTNYG